MCGWWQDHPAIVCSNTLQKDKSSTCLTDQIYKVRRETIVDSMSRLQHPVAAGLRHTALWRGCTYVCSVLRTDALTGVSCLARAHRSRQASCHVAPS